MQVLPLNLQGYPLFLSMGLHPERKESPEEEWPGLEFLAPLP
jgi:hypothetical protein